MGHFDPFGRTRNMSSHGKLSIKIRLLEYIVSKYSTGKLPKHIQTHKTKKTTTEIVGLNKERKESFRVHINIYLYGREKT